MQQQSEKSKNGTLDYASLCSVPGFFRSCFLSLEIERFGFVFHCCHTKKGALSFCHTRRSSGQPVQEQRRAAHRAQTTPSSPHAHSPALPGGTGTMHDSQHNEMEVASQRRLLCKPQEPHCYGNQTKKLFR